MGGAGRNGRQKHTLLSVCCAQSSTCVLMTDSGSISASGAADALRMRVNFVKWKSFTACLYNFAYFCCNVPVAPSVGVYILQSVREL